MDLKLSVNNIIFGFFPILLVGFLALANAWSAGKRSDCQRQCYSLNMAYMFSEPRVGNTSRHGSITPSTPSKCECVAA